MNKKIFSAREGNRGFTLMELLVVIAIIGLLASVVLASLNTARSRGADAAVKSNLNNARPQAELYYDTAGGNYTDLCTATGGVSPMTAATTDAECLSTATAYAIKAPLSTSGHYYCVDSTGAAETYTSGWNDTPVSVCP